MQQLQQQLEPQAKQQLDEFGEQAPYGSEYEDPLLMPACMPLTNDTVGKIYLVR